MDTKKSIQIIELAESDIMPVSKLFSNYFKNNKESFTEQSLKTHLEETSEDVLLRKFKSGKGIFLGCKTENELIGVVYGYSYSGVFFVEWMLVKESWRRKQIGRKLFSEIEKKASVNNHKMLFVSNKKLNLKSYYESMDFEVIGKLNYGWGGDDYWYFGKSI